MALGRHGGYAQSTHVVANVSGLARRIRNVDIVVEDSHGKRGLSQLAVGHEAVGLETLVLSRTHAGKVDGVLGAPIVLLQVAQMIGHHGNIGAPLLLETNEHTHADRVDTGLTHAVEPVAAPLKTALHASGMVKLVVLAIIGFLKADNAVKSVVGKLAILLHLERHNLDLDVREIALGYVDGLGQIRHSGLGGILARNKQDILERSKLFYGAILVFNLLGGEDGAGHRILAMESAIHARVTARIGDVERNEH